MKKTLLIAITTMTLVLCLVLPAAADPILDLGDAVAYWQELAVRLKAENDRLKEENDRLKSENAALEADVEDAEEVIRTLQYDLSELDKLRLQAENDLKISIEQGKSLEEVIKKLSGPRFSATVGATYSKGGPGLMAAISISL